MSGTPGAAGRIERSADLRGWQDWTGFELASGVVEVIDEGGSGRPLRFYRAVGR